MSLLVNERRKHDAIPYILRISPEVRYLPLDTSKPTTTILPVPPAAHTGFGRSLRLLRGAVGYCR